MEEDCQSEAQKNKAEKKGSWTRRNEIPQEVVAGIKEKVSAHVGVKAIAKRAAGQSVKQNWDCSQIEKKEEEEEDDWGKENHMYGHPMAGLLWERQFEKILLKHGWEKVPNWECSFVHREKGLFLFVYVDDIKLAGKKQNLDPMIRH